MHFLGLNSRYMTQAVKVHHTHHPISQSARSGSRDFHRRCSSFFFPFSSYYFFSFAPCVLLSQLVVTACFTRCEPRRKIIRHAWTRMHARNVRIDVKSNARWNVRICAAMNVRQNQMSKQNARMHGLTDLSARIVARKNAKMRAGREY